MRFRYILGHAVRFTPVRPFSSSLASKNLPIMTNIQNGTTGPASAEELPKLSPKDFRVYNRMAEQMDAFVSNVKFPGCGRIQTRF